LSVTDAQNPALRTRELTVDELKKYASMGLLYAILDACDQPAIPAKVVELGDKRAVSLYRGTAEEEYWAIAPYLVHLDSEMVDWIVAALWNEPWGIFAVSEVSLDVIRRHFRKLLTVQSPDGDNLYFRFYDPRVLKTFVQTCTNADLQEFFGPISSFILADLDQKTFAVLIEGPA
jgi:hypothetical protein